MSCTVFFLKKIIYTHTYIHMQAFSLSRFSYLMWSHKNKTSLWVTFCGQLLYKWKSLILHNKACEISTRVKTRSRISLHSWSSSSRCNSKVCSQESGRRYVHLSAQRHLNSFSCNFFSNHTKQLQINGQLWPISGIKNTKFRPFVIQKENAHARQCMHVSKENIQ